MPVVLHNLYDTLKAGPVIVIIFGEISANCEENGLVLKMQEMAYQTVPTETDSTGSLESQEGEAPYRPFACLLDCKHCTS